MFVYVELGVAQEFLGGGPHLTQLAHRGRQQDIVVCRARRSPSRDTPPPFSAAISSQRDCTQYALWSIGQGSGWRPLPGTASGA